MLKRTLNAVRRNHALEHATIAVMMNKQGPMRVVGRASPDGFVWANVTTERLREFAAEALGRSQKGEAHLAVSPLCGTNRSSPVCWPAQARTWPLLWAAGMDGLTNAVLAALVGVVAAQTGRLCRSTTRRRPTWMASRSPASTGSAGTCTRFERAPPDPSGGGPGPRPGSLL